MRWLVLLLLLPAAAAADCPPPPDHAADRARLLAEIQAAPDEPTARRLTDGMWRLWTDAPDARAQDLLDRGMARREAWDLDAAVALLGELVAYCPLYAEGWNQRAFAYFLKSEHGLALTDLERALELDPDHFAARAGLALVLMRLGRHDAGQGMLRTALALNPWLPERAMLLPEPQPPGEEL